MQGQCASPHNEASSSNDAAQNNKEAGIEAYHGNHNMKCDDHPYQDGIDDYTRAIAIENHETVANAIRKHIANMGTRKLGEAETADMIKTLFNDKAAITYAYFVAGIRKLPRQANIVAAQHEETGSKRLRQAPRSTSQEAPRQALRQAHEVRGRLTLGSREEHCRH